MTIQTELRSWFSSGPSPTLQSAPKPGDEAPSTSVLSLSTSKPSILAFLRHCGCPFSEQTFLNLRKSASAHPEIDFIAISHSDQAATDAWHKSLPAPTGSSEPLNLRIVVDDKKEAYAAYGLGVSALSHVINYTSFSKLRKLGSKEGGGISVRPTQSGSRWQTSGTYAVDGSGVVRWGHPAERADDVPDMNEAIGSVQTKA